MSASGIIMSGDNPRLILDGSKTRSRRTYGLEAYNKEPERWKYIRREDDGRHIFGEKKGGSLAQVFGERCPYGDIGDRLAVLEKWRTLREWDRIKPSELPIVDDAFPDAFIDWATSPSRQIHGKWRSAIHLPRRLARMRIELLDVRAERLHEITEEEAKTEGMRDYHMARWPDGDPGYIYDVYRRNYSALWETINGKGSWALNPWVWVLAFEKE